MLSTKRKLPQSASFIQNEPLSSKSRPRDDVNDNGDEDDIFFTAVDENNNELTHLAQSQLAIKPANDAAREEKATTKIKDLKITVKYVLLLYKTNKS